MTRAALIAHVLLCVVLARMPTFGQEQPHRVVSLVPATTEMLFAMGAGDRLVGLGSYDRFPPQVAAIPRVGGLLNPNTERIIALRPDLVILYETQEELKRQLERADIPYYRYEHQALPDITSTIRALGERIGAPQRAHDVAVGIERDIEAVRRSVAGLDRPSTLLVFTREPGSLRSITASGGYGFLADLMDVAGASNVFGEIQQQSVQASAEMILARRPDVIIELQYGAGAVGRSDGLEAWKTLASVPAVRTGRVHVLTGDQFVVPGPRIVLAAQQLARAIHPQ
jgi:iron complex transport system substrate-binding protein